MAAPSSVLWPSAGTLSAPRRLCVAAADFCRIFVVLAATATLPGCYAVNQALHQNDLFNTRRPVEDVIDDPATPPKTRAQLELVDAVLRFAAAEGLATKGAYRYFIETKEPVVSYLVQAAQADRLESVTWWFPIIGEVPYRGYFEKSERDEKAAELVRVGYDVHLSGAGAFSSLGWFDDPIFNSMLVRNEAELAHLFFHELTHRTFWAPGSTRFNENLAEYVAGELTVKYLAAKGDAAAIARYGDKRVDRALFHGWIVRLRAELETLYANQAGLAHPALLAAKAQVYARFQKPPDKPPFKAVDFVAGEDWNNASLLGASLYSPDTEAFAKAHACLGSRAVAVFLKTLETLTTRLGDPFAALDAMCASATKASRNKRGDHGVASSGA